MKPKDFVSEIKADALDDLQRFNKLREMFMALASLLKDHPTPAELAGSLTTEEIKEWQEGLAAARGYIGDQLLLMVLTLEIEVRERQGESS